MLAFASFMFVIPICRAWGVDSNRHGFMTYILCCPMGTWDALAPKPGPAIFGGDWIDMGDKQANFPGTGFTSWGAAVDFCIAQGAEGLCPLDTICPDGAGAPPFGGRRSGGTGDDQWAPYGGDGQNKWVQTGQGCVSSADTNCAGNTCMSHSSIASGDPHWGTAGARQNTCKPPRYCWHLGCILQEASLRTGVDPTGSKTVGEQGYLDWILW